MSLTHGAYVLDSDPTYWSQEFPIKRQDLFNIFFIAQQRTIFLNFIK